MANTHLCGSVYNAKAADRCPSLLYVDKPGMTHGNAEINVTVKTYCYTVFETICVKQLPGYIFSKDGSILHIEPINNWKDGRQP